jgi:MinD-like ATPase involved in chromosome partitioning or flagellar assembly
MSGPVVPVIAAVTGASWEASLVAGLERSPSGISVVRRCVDLADLLAVAATGTARAALLSAELRRLDRDALARLASARVAVVGLFTPGDEAAATRLRRLGVGQVLAADASPVDIAVAVTSAVLAVESADSGAAPGWSQPLDAFADGASVVDGASTATDLAAPGTGRLVAVWGPTGAPGRTTVAVGVAGELARAGVSTLLADADVYGGVVAQVLGFLDEAPGLAAATRLANNGTLDVAGLARVAPQVSPGLRVLTGISRAERWPELRPAALEQVWDIARRLAGVTVVDCGFCLEQDEELSFDTAAPRRNGATLATLEAADVVVAVGTGDPVGVQRLVRGLTQLREVLPGVLPRVVVNRVRRSAVGPDPETQLRQALERYAGVHDVTFVPEDRDALDAALLQAQLLGEVAPDSAVRTALADLAASLTGRPAPTRKRGLLRRGA